MARFLAAAKRFCTHSEGASIVEYALLVALLAAVCIVAMASLGNSLSNAFTTVTGSI
jgi:pilus assembly protein Flp/PilA